MTGKISLDIGATTDELARINHAVAELAEAESWPSEFTFQVTLVLEELEMNIIHYAYDDRESAGSRITLHSERDRLRIEIMDRGKPFNPITDTEQPDLDAELKDRRPGGLGVHLVRSLVDEMSYRREGDRNYLTLIKHRNE